MSGRGGGEGPDRDRVPAPDRDPAAPASSDGARAVDREIERLRRNIDEVDAVLVKLLNQRALWALEIGVVKRGAGVAIYQPDREAEVVDHVDEVNQGPLSAEAVRRLFERIIDESRRLERTGGG